MFNNNKAEIASLKRAFEILLTDILVLETEVYDLKHPNKYPVGFKKNGWEVIETELMRMTYCGSRYNTRKYVIWNSEKKEKLKIEPWDRDDSHIRVLEQYLAINPKLK